MVTNRDYEKCYYCDDEALYSQLVGNSPDEYTVTGVCKKHVKMDLIS
jgi:hypothetical protein